MAMVFQDRREAGRRLAEQLRPLADEDPAVLALPRGGVPVAFEVARVLSCPMDVIAVRKLGAPGNPELAVGAVAEDGTTVFDGALARRVGMSPELYEQTLARESAELRRRVEEYRRGRSVCEVSGRTVILVDDGFATGMSDLAAVRAIRRLGAARIVACAPVGSRQAVALLAEEADEVACVMIPEEFFGVGQWYEDFSPTSDEEVVALLRRAA